MRIKTFLHAIVRYGWFARVLAAVGALGLAVIPASAQTPQCTTPVIFSTASVASTGLAENIGSIQFTCTGGTSNTLVAGDFFVTLNTNITNSLDQNGNSQFITVSSTGAAVTTSPPVLVSSTVLDIAGLSYTVPTPNSTPVSITISGIRASLASIQNGLPATVTASLHWLGGNVPGTQMSVATGAAPLLSSAQNNIIPCYGSSLPAATDFATFLNSGTASSAVRVSEAYLGALTPKDPTATNGMRIIVQYSGFPAASELFVPNAVVGNTGSIPTSAGEFGAGAAVGEYIPSSNQLLLSFVTGADQTGAGGILVYPAPVAAGSYTDMSQLTVTGGSAYAVYEVVDHNPLALETVQIPVFEVTPAYACANPPPVTLSAMAAPVSTVSIATMTDPIPRYIPAALADDCTLIGDCNAGYFPILSVNTTPLSLTGASMGVAQNASVAVVNNGGSAFSFTVSTTYFSGANWLTVTPSSGDDPNNVTLTIAANPAALQPGNYTANVTVNAGVYGTATVPVGFSVGPAGPTIQNIENAASGQTGAVAPGSYVALYGLNLAGANVGVTFNAVPATVIYDSAGQINLIVPASLSGQASAAVVVTVNGQPSNSFNVILTANAPGIFTPGILNSDSSLNQASNPATRGTFVQVYFTGLAIPVAAGSVTLNMGSQTGIVPLYAGAQGTEAALDQINVVVPAGLAFTGNSTPLTVCVTLAAGQPICSNTVSLYVQ